MVTGKIVVNQLDNIDGIGAIGCSTLSRRAQFMPAY